jgi:hypothetical protein
MFSEALSDGTTTYFLLKELLNNYDQQLHQYQQNED